MKTTGLTLEWTLRKPRHERANGALAGSVTAADRPVSGGGGGSHFGGPTGTTPPILRSGDWTPAD